MARIGAADGPGPSLGAPHSRRIARITGTVVTAGHAVLWIACLTGRLRCIHVGARTTFLPRARPGAAAHMPLPAGTAVRVALVAGDRRDMAIVVEVVGTPQAMDGRSPRSALPSRTPRHPAPRMPMPHRRPRPLARSTGRGSDRHRRRLAANACIHDGIAARRGGCRGRSSA